MLSAMRQLMHGGVDHDSEGKVEHGVLPLQIASMFIIFLVTVVFALIPFKLKNFKWFTDSSIMSLANCVSGGIFLGFAFLHVLPDAVEGFREYREDLTDLQIVYIVCMFGFFSVLAVEKIIVYKVLKRDITISKSSESDKNNQDEEKSLELPQCGPKDDGCGCDDTPQGQIHEGHFHTHSVPFRTASAATPYIIAFSLCFHSIFEGIALGVQIKLEKAIVLLVGIALHKCGEGFAMGVSFVKASTPKRQWFFLVFLFGIIVPVGIGIGIGVSSTGKTASLVASILGSFAAGSFIYVALLGIIVEEFSGFDRLWRKFFCVIGGFIAMGLITVLSERFSE